MATPWTTKLAAIALAATLGLAASPARAEDTGQRCVAALPFGVGQFQNGQVALGSFFAAGEILLGATSFIAAVVSDRLASTDVSGRAPGRPVDIVSLNRSLQAAATTNRIAFAGWAALTAAGVIEAQVNFAPHRSAGGGPRAARASLAVTAAPTVGGGLLGVRAAF